MVFYSLHKYLHIHKMGILKLISIAAVVIYLPALYFIWSYTGTETEMPSSNASYLINTPGCKIIEVDPLEETVAKYIRAPVMDLCPPDHFSSFEGQVLSLDENITRIWTENGTVPLSCCYRSIYRVQQELDKYIATTADNLVRYSDCHEIEPGKSVILNDSYVKVECNTTDSYKTEFHATVLPPSILSNESMSKVSYWDERNEKGLQSPPSILVIGIDSISRLHMQRSLPKTIQVLEENDFIEMKGYTKIADNTFPNIMGAFAGFPPTSNASCLLKNLKAMDNCPIIWKNFSRLNYLTTHLEDYPDIAIFNFEKVGFVLPPVDYYLRPFMIAMEKFQRTGATCIAGERSTNFIMNFAEKFVKLMGRKYPYFHFSWLTTLSHDDFNGLRTADDLFANFFRNMTNNSTGDPDNTVMIFLSDHGNRMGKFRETFMGFYEVNLPFFYMRIPESLKRQFPDWYFNMKRNSEMLTSPLSVFSALSQILNHAKSMVTDIKGPEGVSNSEFQSLFEHIPDTLTCEDAHIPSEYCMCGVNPKISKKSELTNSMGGLIVDKVNEILKAPIEDDLCYTLKFREFLYGRELESGKDHSGRHFTDYLIAVETRPGLAHFEAKVRVTLNGTMEVMGDISRTNRYGDQSYCMNNAKLKLYCKCKGVYGKRKKA